MRLLVPLLVVVLATRAGADPLACRREIAKQSARYAQAAMRAVAACGDKVIAGRLPASTDCETEPKTVARIATARTKAAAGVAKRCCGGDTSCGNGDDETLAAVGWDLGTCPNLENGACVNSLANPGDVSTCTSCVDGAAADRLLAVAFGPSGPAPGPTPVAACRRALAKETSRLFVARSKALARCRDARLLGRHANPCPVPGDGKAGPAIAKAEAKATARICTACGGTDKLCGGAADLTPAAIGAPTHCPAVQVPGGASCGASIASVADVAVCLTCVAAFTGTCADTLAVPSLDAYPTECNPPSPVCAAGVTCADDEECPIGYTCEDNGGNTRYCVGAACGGDEDCTGGGICRQYCTFGFGGCAAPRCQCPGFGCSGPDEVCLDQNGLACNKLCTQDSDCIAPFGFVCVNAGFADGICIGSIPCQ